MRNAAVANRATVEFATESQVQDPKKIFFPSDFKGKVVDVQYGRHHVLALTSSGKAGCCFRLFQNSRNCRCTLGDFGGCWELAISWLCWALIEHGGTSLNENDSRHYQHSRPCDCNTSSEHFKHAKPSFSGTSIRSFLSNSSKKSVS